MTTYKKEPQISLMQKLKSVLVSIEQSGRIDMDVLQQLTQEEKEIVNTLFHENLVSEALVFLEEMDTDAEWQEFMEKVNASKKQRGYGDRVFSF